MVRTWLVAHHGFGFTLSAAALTAALCWFGRALVPGATGGPPIPLWALSPPAFAILASAVTVNSMPELVPSIGRLRCGRLAWLLLVLLVSCVGAALATLATGLGSIVPATCLLVVLTFGASAVLGRSALLIGAVPAVAIVTLTPTVTLLEAELWLPQRDPRLWLLLVAVAAVGAIRYVLIGARPPRYEARLVDE